MATLEQERAQYAWSQVQTHAVRAFGKEYASLAKSAPALIMNNGLMQTLAFYNFKGKDHHKELNRHILGWLCRRNLVNDTGFEAAMNSLHRATPGAFRRATQEALELLKWVRQFAAVADG